ncbi:unnamed protein product [Cuscuta epithymum]|nr:unnamed protein product [Cuscuta epithymum]
MYTSSSSGRLPKTRSQWSDFYMDYNEEKKRKRRVLSESDEYNVVVIEEEEEEEAWRGVHDRSDEVVLESSNDDMKRFSFDDREETRGVVQEMSFFFNKGNGKKKKKKEEGDMTDGIEFWEDSDPKEKRDKGKEKENSPNRAFEHGLMKRVQMGERRAAVGWGSSSSSIHKRRKAPAEIALAQHGVKKMKGAFDASSINRRRKFTRMASEQSRHGLKQMKETERGKAKAALGGSSVKQRRINDDDDVVFLGESFSGSGIPFRTGSGSGSKVGSVGGRSPDIGTCDEVASSTTKTMFKEAVVGPEGDYSDASSLESRDSEEEEEEECDDSEDADYKENAFSSSASSSSSGMEEEENGLSSSEESDEEGYHNRNMVKGQSEHAEKDPHVPKTKAASKKHRNKRKRNEKQKSKHTEKDSAQILQTKLHSENERHKQKWLDEKKHKSASEKQTSEKNYEIIRTKSAAASKRDKKKRKKIHEKKKKKKKHRSFDPENDEEIFKTTETSKKDEKEKHKKIDVKKKHKNLSSWKDAEFIKDKASSKKDRDKHGGGSDDEEEEIFKTTETSKKDEKEKHKKIDVQKKHKNLSSWKDAEFIKAKASSKKDRDKHRGGSDEKQHEKVDDAVEVADVLKTKEHSKKDKKKHKGVGEKKHKRFVDGRTDSEIIKTKKTSKKDRDKNKRIGEKQKSDVINGDKDAEIFKNEGTPQKDREKKHRGSDNKRHKKVGDAEKDTEILKTKASSKKEKNKHKGIDEEQHSTEHAEIDAEVLKTRLTSKKDRKKQKRIGEKHKEVDAEKDSETHKTKATPEKDKEKQKGVGEKQRGASSGEAADSGKQEGVASRLRSHSHSKSSKKEETQSSSSEGLGVGSSVGEDRQGGDDDDLEKENEEEKKDVVTQTTGTSERKQPRRNLDVKNILLNTMLENEGKFNETVPLAEENIPKQLPLKFTFYEDNEAPDKEEWEFEIDNLFADFQMGRLQSEIGSTAKPMVANKIADDAQPCWHPEGHLHILDEQIGILCKHCSVVFLESKHILPEFAKRPTSCRRNERGRFNHLYGEAEQSVGDMELDNMPRNDPTSSSFHRAGTVWDLIPHHIKARMYLHQRQGLEFIWKNIAGELVLEKLQDLSSGGRGCIISHAPGTGKTGLTVVFLQSFMKLFPLCHPVVIAPRSMLLTWESEFKKWDVDIPFHNLNSRSLSGKEDVEEVHILRRKGKDMNRLLKLYSWAKGSGILGITYRLFEQLAGGTSCEEEDEKMRKILLKFPGLLVLDEGHTPRNEESLVWKALSRVETPRRIILSGTPFQNNFHELYNTLSLVCPEFTVGSTPGGVGSSDPKKKQQQQQLTRKGIRKGRENWASITGSILNTENERNVEELRRLIGPLVHVHKGTILQEKLPGLMIWQVYLKLTPTQQKLQKMICSKKFMEQDNWMTLISVHPSLAPEGEARGVNELDPGEGVKTRFVAELVRASEGRGERVIVFSRLLEPLTLIRRQLQGEFPGWGDGREVLYMDGKIDAKYRQERIGSFNDPESEAKVLLASTAACCEGINLIGASRIVLLDVVWNPSVTRQAISRAYRLGQTKVVHVYNLISSSFEANKYACQAKKDRMSELVFTADHPDHPDHDDAVPADQDLILGAMLQDHSLSTMFHKIVRQPKNHQMLWPEFTN